VGDSGVNASHDDAFLLRSRVRRANGSSKKFQQRRLRAQKFLVEPGRCPLVELPCNEWKEQRQWKKIRGSLRTRASRSVKAILAKAIQVRAIPVRAIPVSVRVRIIPVKAVGPVRTTLDKAIPARADSVPVRTLPDKGSLARAAAG
jgi:hypothetical protein